MSSNHPLPSRKRISHYEDKTDAADEDFRSSSSSLQHQVIPVTTSPRRVEAGAVIAPVSDRHPSPSRKRISHYEDKTDAADEDFRSSSSSLQHQVIPVTTSPRRVEAGAVIAPVSDRHPSPSRKRISHYEDKTDAADEDFRSSSSSLQHQVIPVTTSPRRVEAGAVIAPVSDHLSSLIPFTQPCSGILIQFHQVLTYSASEGSPERTLDMFESLLDVSTFPFFLNLYHPYASTTQYLDVLVSATTSKKLLLFLDLSPSQNPLMHKLFIFRLFFHVEIDLFIHVCKKRGYNLLFMMSFFSLYMSPNDVVHVLSGYYHIEDIISSFEQSVQEPWINVVEGMFYDLINLPEILHQMTITPSMLSYCKSNFSTNNVQELLLQLRSDVTQLTKQCSKCKFGRHYLEKDTRTNQCLFHFKEDDGQIETNTIICKHCSMHSFKKMLFKKEKRSEQLQVPCLKLTVCYSCLLFGHTIKDCLLFRKSGVKYMTFYTLEEAVLYYPVQTSIQHQVDDIDSLREYEESDEPRLQRQLKVCFSENQSRPLVAFIARVLNFLSYETLLPVMFDLKSFSDPHFIPHLTQDNFYYVSSVQDNLFSLYYYIPHYFRLNFCILYYTLRKLGPFYNDFCSDASPSILGFLSDVLDSITIKFHDIHQRLFTFKSKFNLSQIFTKKPLVIQDIVYDSVEEGKTVPSISIPSVDPFDTLKFNLSQKFPDYDNQRVEKC
ncbi:hypothetical protein RCL1_004095 [Eukaryota sp. TZLM3-RCL]